MPKYLKKTYNLTQRFYIPATPTDYTYEYPRIANLKLWSRMEQYTPLNYADTPLTPAYVNDTTHSTPAIGSYRYNAAHTDGSSYVNIPDTTGIIDFSSAANGGPASLATDEACTISIWVNPSGLSPFGLTPFGRYYNGGDGFLELSLTPLGSGTERDYRVSLFLMTDASNYITKSVSYQTHKIIRNRWSHIVLTYDGTGTLDGDGWPNGWTVYIDGDAIDWAPGETALGTYAGLIPDFTEPFKAPFIRGTPPYDTDSVVSVAELAIWNTNLSLNEIAALYNGTRDGVYFTVSGFLNNPPRTTLSTRDNAIGSYPTRAMTTGFAGNTGVHSSSFNDQDTVIFNTPFAEAILQFHTPFQSAGQTVRLRDQDLVYTTFEIKKGDHQVTAGNIPINYDTLSDAKRNNGLPYTHQVAIAFADSIKTGSYGYTTTVDGNLVSITYNKAGAAPGYSVQLNMSGVFLLNSRMMPTDEFGGGNTDPVSYPTLLQPTYYNRLLANNMVPPSMVATPNLSGTLTGTGIVQKGIADTNLQFTSDQQTLSPFDESRVPAKNVLDEFQAVGTPYTVYPGFSGSLYDKTQIVVDLSIPDGTSSSVWFGTGSGAPIDSQTWANSEAGLKAGINSGLSYFNFDSNQWNAIGDFTTGSNVNILGYKMDVITGAMASCVPTNHFGYSGYTYLNQGYLDTYPAFGLPTPVCGFPQASKFDATGSQLLDMSQYLTAPFVVEKVELHVSASFGLWTVGKSTGAANVEGVPTDTFMLINQFDTPVSGAFAYGSPSAHKYSYSGLTRGWYRMPANWTMTKMKEIVWFHRVGVFQRDNATRGFEGVANLKQLSESLYRAVETWVPNTLGNSSADAPNFVTGTFSLKSPARTVGKYKHQLVSPVSTLQREYGGGSSAGSSPGPGEITDLYFDNIHGGRSLFTMTDGVDVSGRPLVADYFTGVPEASASQVPWVYYPGNRQITTPYAGWAAEPTTAYDKYFTDAPYVLMPTDKLVLAVSHNQLPYDATHYYGGDRNAREYVTKFFPGRAKLILYGSLVKNNKEYHESSNQWLTSNALHESLGTNPVVDQFDVNPRITFSGSYVATVISGSLLPEITPSEWLQQYNKISTLDPKAMDEAGRPRMVVGDGAGGTQGTTGSLLRGVACIDSKERFYDTMLPEFSQIWDLDGFLFFRAYADDIFTGYPGATLLYGNRVDNPYVNYKWRGSFPFEPKYSTIERKPASPNKFSSAQLDQRGDPTYEIGTVAIYPDKSIPDPNSSYAPDVDYNVWSTWQTPVGGSEGAIQSNPPVFDNQLFKIFMGHGDGTYQYGFADVDNALVRWEGGAIGQYTRDTYRGWKYGLLNAVPQQSRAVYRWNHYGQFRDMLEQRYDSRYYDGTELSTPAVICKFKYTDPSTGVVTPSPPTETHCQNMSQFATSSVPFFDAYRVIMDIDEATSTPIYSTGGYWTYGRDRDDDPDARTWTTTS